MDSNKTLNIGIIGFGPKSSAQTFHVPLISYEPRMRITKVSSIHVAEAQSLLPDIPVTGEPADIIGDPAINVVVIATPIQYHFEYAKQALEAGKHVVVEKPITVTAAEADQLIAIAAGKNLLLSQFHNRRWDGGFLTLKQLLADNRLGEPLVYEANYDRWTPVAQPSERQARQGGGVLYDLGPHMIDQALVLFGRPQSVAAVVATQRPECAADDYFMIEMAYGKKQVLLRANLVSALPGPRYKLTGSHGGYIKHMASFGSDPQASMLARGMRPADEGWGEDQPADYGILSDGSSQQPVPTVAGSYQSFYAGIAAALLDGATPPVPVADARDTVAIIEAALRSHREGVRLQASDIGFTTA